MPKSTIDDLRAPLAGIATQAQSLKLPSRIPGWLDIRKAFYLGYLAIETPGYVAYARIHDTRQFGIAGTRIHELRIWRSGEAHLTARNCLYENKEGAIRGELDSGGQVFLNLILEYFQ